VHVHVHARLPRGRGWRLARQVLPTVKPEDVAGKFPKGVDIKTVPSGKAYLRHTPQPNK
jgi:hypothetical protein